MKLDAIYNILFIDDEIYEYLPVLLPAATEQGFILYEAKNVSAGLSLLSENPEAIDAVLLDLTFSIGEMQGEMALKIIKQNFPYLPVVILTGSDKASDLRKVVDCMRNGAYDYIGKQQLDPYRLFELLFEAIQKARQQFRVDNRALVNKNSKDFFYIVQVVNSGRFQKQAVFGFRLESVNKPKDEKEQAQIEKSALQWHENMLKSVQIGNKENLLINLKFIAEKGKIDCYLIFTLSETDEVRLKNSVSNLVQDLRSFFKTNLSDKLQPYIFEEITNSKFLESANQTSPKFNYTLFYRKPVKIIETIDLGFTSSRIKNGNHSAITTPSLIIPFPSPVNYDKEVLTALLNQDHYTEIDVQLKPKNLSIEENQTIRQVIQKPYMLFNSPNPEKGIAYCSYLEQFISSGNDKFAVSVLLKQTKSYFDQHLKTGIFNYFFGASSDVEHSSRTYKNLSRYNTVTNEDLNQLTFTYNQTNVLQAFRLPFPDCNFLPGMRQQPHTFQLCPENLPTHGLLLGEKNRSREPQQIRINHDDLARHLYIMGQTGTGKSTMLKTMITDCLKKNLPFALIDPHGDLFDEVQKLIPDTKKNKTLIIDTTDPVNSSKHNPIGFDSTNPQSKSLVINELVRILGTLYDMRTVGGPMFELYLKNGLLLIMDEQVILKFGTPTLQNFVDMFFDNSYRADLLDTCSNKKIKNFFDIAEQNSGDWSFSNFATYITSKLNRFTDDFYLSPIITSTKNNINFRTLIDRGNILLVKLDKGLIGADNASLLGQMLVSNIVMAAMSRANVDQKKRKRYYLFIDEFQNFIKGDVSNALSEVRKYGLNMILANQTLGQLKDNYNDVIEGLMGNVGSMIFFRPGINDYEKIRHYIEPEFERHDVLKLANFSCIGRIMIENVPCDPFVFQTKTPEHLINK